MAALLRLLITTLCLGLLFPGTPTALADTPLPRLDQCRVIYVYEAGTKLAQTLDGSFCIDQELQPFDAQCAARYRDRPLPFAHPRLRGTAGADTDWLDHEPLKGVDARGRPWFLHINYSGPVLILAHIEQGELRQETLPGGYCPQSELPACPPHWPLVGQEILGGSDGSLSVIEKNALRTIRDDKSSRVIFPVPADASEASDLAGEGSPYWAHQTYRFGSQLWIIRSFYANCHTAGSFVLRIADDQAKVIMRAKSEYVCGLVRHGGAVYLLVDERISTTTPDTYLAKRILRCTVEPPPKQAPAAIQRAIADLDSEDFKVRQAASNVLVSLPEAQLSLLQEQLKGKLSDEQNARLIQAIVSIQQRAVNPEPAKLGTFDAARLLFVDAAGRQYVQQWIGGKPSTHLLVLDEKNAVEVELSDPAIAFDCQGDDGLVYAHDGRFLYVFDPKDGRPRAIASLGALAGAALRVFATRQGQLCLALKVGDGSRDPELFVWLDPARAANLPLLQGTVIAGDLPLQFNGDDHYPTALGPEDQLWFVRNHVSPVVARDTRVANATVTTQILRASGKEVVQLSEPVATSFHPSLWPLGKDSAIVSTSSGMDKVDGVIFYDRGATHREESLKDILEKHHERLLKVMPDGVCLSAGEDYERCQLARLGDAFYLEETVYRALANGGGNADSTGLFRAGKWRDFRERQPAQDDGYDPLIPRLTDIDIAGGRLLGFGKNCAALQWFTPAKHPDWAETIEVRATPWACFWPNLIAMPRFSGGWMLTPDAATRFLKLVPERVAEAKKRGSTNPDWDARYQSDDFTPVRRWDHGAWKTLDRSLSGGTVWEDGAGGVWHLRVREAEVLYPDRPSQLIALDAGETDSMRLVVESPDAVWLATRQSLLRFTRPRQAGEKVKPGLWALDRRFQLPRLGIDFAGPWIAGANMYWVTAGDLVHTTLADLLRTPRETSESAPLN